MDTAPSVQGSSSGLRGTSDLFLNITQALKWLLCAPGFLNRPIKMKKAWGRAVILRPPEFNPRIVATYRFGCRSMRTEGLCSQAHICTCDTRTHQRCSVCLGLFFILRICLFSFICMSILPVCLVPTEVQGI